MASMVAFAKAASAAGAFAVVAEEAATVDKAAVNDAH